jgi:DNA-binding NarL/FixJ family response regulator
MASSPQFASSARRDQVVTTLQTAITAYYGLASNPVVQSNPARLARVHQRIAEAEERLVCLLDRRPARLVPREPDARPITPAADQPLVVVPTPPSASPTPDRLLTARHREVLRLLARGYSNAQIAHALVIEPGTVANHVAAILRRLGLRSRTEVAVWAVRHGVLLDQPAGDA